MRQGQQNRRGRGRNRKSQNPMTRSFESTGPDVKLRGTPSHIAEKYMSLARDALSSGDPVLAENYMQHAEHYNRIIMTFREQQMSQGGGDPFAAGMARPATMGGSDLDDGDEFGDDEGGDFGPMAGQPDLQGMPQPQMPPMQPPQQYGEQRPRFDNNRPQHQNQHRRDNRHNNHRHDRNDNRYDRGDRGDRQDFRNDRGDRQDFRGDRGDRQDFRSGQERNGNGNGEHRNFRNDRGDRGEQRDFAPPPPPPPPPLPPQAAEGGVDRGADRGSERPIRRERFQAPPVAEQPAVVPPVIAHEQQPEFLRRPVRRPRAAAVEPDAAPAPAARSADDQD